MAETFGFDVANSLLGKLASYACEEAFRTYGVYEDLQGFKDTLSIANGVMLDAEYKKDQKHGLHEWLRQIQNICSDAEDIFDGIEFQHKHSQIVKGRHLFSSSNPLVFRLRMACQIKEIRGKLDKLVADGTTVGLDMHEREMTYPDDGC
ncbi:uncharacterized protein LOC131610316 [Vicia villosa]|uniref:uncharacterized protein LOC131610316 n=1 Tax=Vicia villosa TaxID=3911 RepID=UPI00273B91B5|nr:uncharacterized protein LOC131610316 [Vicia villosa]